MTQTFSSHGDVMDLQREIRRKTIIFGVIAAILAVALATTVSVALYPLIEERFFYPSESSDQEPTTLPPMSEAIPVTANALLNEPSNYHLKRVAVSGKVSQLGLVRGPYFLLDEKIWVCYYNQEQGMWIDISNVKNGDDVTVTGRFWSPDTIYAEKIERA